MLLIYIYKELNVISEVDTYVFNNYNNNNILITNTSATYLYS